MNTRFVDVYLGASEPIPVGRAYFNGFGKALTTSFTYSQQWLSNSSAFALAPCAPLTSGTSHCAGVPGFLADASPDRWGRRLVQRGERLAAVQQERPPRGLDDVDYLVGVDDWSRMGALRLSTDGGATFLGIGTDIPKVIALPRLLASVHAVQTDDGAHEELKELLAAGSSSLGGARPKATVSAEGRLMLAKFPSAGDEWDVMGWEAWTLSIAERAGLHVPRFRLERIGSQGVLLTERFDRVSDDQEGRPEGEPARVPFMSCMTLLDARDGDASDYADVCDMLRVTSCDAKADLREMYARVVLSVALNNTDDHLRNHGMLHGPKGWRLSPLYDVNPSPHFCQERSTSVWGHVGADSAEGLNELAGSIGLADDDRDKMVARVISAFAGWERLARHLGCPEREVRMFAPTIEAGIRSIVKR